MKLKKGDQVIVLYGKDKGQKGKIERVYPKRNKVLIQNINVYKRHVKKQNEQSQGGIAEVSRPIDASKVALICPKTKLKTRIGYTMQKGEKKRITKKGDQIL